MKFIETKVEGTEDFRAVAITPHNLNNKQIAFFLKERGLFAAAANVGWYDHPNASDSPVYFFADNDTIGVYVRLIPARVFESNGDGVVEIDPDYYTRF